MHYLLSFSFIGITRYILCCRIVTICRVWYGIKVSLHHFTVFGEHCVGQVYASLLEHPEYFMLGYILIIIC